MNMHVLKQYPYTNVLIKESHVFKLAVARDFYQTSSHIYQKRLSGFQDYLEQMRPAVKQIL